MKTITVIIVLMLSLYAHAQDQKYTIKNIDANTEYSDFGTAYFGNEYAVFASSKKVKGARNKKWYANNQPFLELYKAAVSDNGELQEVELFSKEVNTKMHESNLIFTKDLKTVYFSRDNYTNKKYKTDEKGWVLIQLYKANIDSVGKWINIVKLPFNSDLFDTGHPALNAAETKLYFTSNRPGSVGMTDIWAVDILNDNTYSEPYNLGLNVNSTRSEMFPYIDNNNVLFFASDGRNDSNGGLDIYAINMEGNAGVGNARNLGFPINSLKDDFALVYQNNKNKGHFSSNRAGGKGDDDIYFFTEIPAAIPCSQTVKGVVREKESGNLLPGATVVLYDGKGSVIETKIADEGAAFSFKVNCEVSYKVVATKTNFSADEKTFLTSKQADLALSLNLDLGSEDFVYNRGKVMIKINPIYFDLDKSFIRPDAQIELLKVVSIMKKYPLLRINLGSHTDSRASDVYNLLLSMRRAKASKDWIVKQGIDPDRISPQGFGETDLINKCANGVACSAEEHQLNRRTEFVIMNPEAIKGDSK
ncbi:MAG: OmpA family protein [Flavobacterium sp.]